MDTECKIEALELHGDEAESITTEISLNNQGTSCFFMLHVGGKAYEINAFDMLEAIARTSQWNVLLQKKSVDE